MRKLLIFLGLVLLFTMTFAACEKTESGVTIATDVEEYSPLASSIQGITMTPIFNSDGKYGIVEYHWVAGKGSFILFDRLVKDVVNEGGDVLWGAIEDDQVADINEPFEIQLEVVDSENNTILANTAITIVRDGAFYRVEAQN
ncbi:hypothetical protein JR334_03935 [Clostridia bacterium]|nr:hypothetical protein JR334_03935 [Clostridia bacterium]